MGSAFQVPVAQLDRASASGAEGYRFEPCRGYLTHNNKPWFRQQTGGKRIFICSKMFQTLA